MRGVRKHREDTWTPGKEAQTVQEKLEIRAQDQIDQLEKEMQAKINLLQEKLQVSSIILAIPAALLGVYNGVELGRTVSGLTTSFLFGLTGPFITLILLAGLLNSIGTFYERCISRSLEVKKKRFKLLYDLRMSKVSQSLLRGSF